MTGNLSERVQREDESAPENNNAAVGFPTTASAV